RRQIVGAADAVGHIVAAARVGPAGVPLLVARGELNDLRAPLRPTSRAATDVVGKPHLVKRHHMALRPSDTARAMSAFGRRNVHWTFRSSASPCVRDCRKLWSSGHFMMIRHGMVTS